MNQALYIILSFFVLVNLVALLVMFMDKCRSRKIGAERISEGLLFFMAIAFGSIGVCLGMFFFRHKTKKWYFIIGVPLMILQNSATVYLAYSIVRH
jgi:uncharacterized membrane protein YsdA (DUF1294 family)